MSGSEHHVVVGDRGRVVLPQEVRRTRGLDAGTRLILFDTDEGLVLMTRDQLLRRVRRDFAAAGVSLVDELLADRRAEAARENADSPVGG